GRGRSPTRSGRTRFPSPRRRRPGSPRPAPFRSTARSSPGAAAHPTAVESRRSATDGDRVRNGRRRRTRRRAVVLATAASAGHVLCPAWLALATRGRAEPRRPPPPVDFPALTVLVAAHREAGVIASKVDDVRGNGYAGPLEVIVLADGDPETAEAARRAGARV